MTANETRDHIDALLAQWGITYGAIYLGESVNADKWKHDKWSVRFTLRDGRAAHEEFDYMTGIGLRTKMTDTAAGRLAAHTLRNCKGSIAWAEAEKAHCKPVAPRAADVLYSLQMDSDAIGMSFSEWCGEFSYDSDSIKARDTYDACQENADKIRRVFTRAQLDQIAEALQDF